MGYKMTVHNGRTEQELVEQIAAGDQQAFGALFDIYMLDVFKFCYSILLNRTAAEDATQEVFAKLWVNAQNWQPDASIKTWLMRVARNHCVDVLRKKKNDLKKHQDMYKDVLSSEDNVLKSTPEKDLDYEKHSKIIKNALFSLPERQREAVMLVYYTELPNTEAADIMGMKPAAFDSLLARARRTLRQRLGSETEAWDGYLALEGKSTK